MNFQPRWKLRQNAELAEMGLKCWREYSRERIEEIRASKRALAAALGIDFDAIAQERDFFACEEAAIAAWKECKKREWRRGWLLALAIAVAALLYWGK